jgi:hypothetical protein
LAKGQIICPADDLVDAEARRKSCGRTAGSIPQTGAKIKKLNPTRTLVAGRSSW